MYKETLQLEKKRYVERLQFLNKAIKKEQNNYSNLAYDMRSIIFTNYDWERLSYIQFQLNISRDNVQKLKVEWCKNYDYYRNCVNDLKNLNKG